MSFTNLKLFIASVIFCIIATVVFVIEKNLFVASIMYILSGICFLMCIIRMISTRGNNHRGEYEIV